MSIVEELDKYGKFTVQQARSNLSKLKKNDTSNLYKGISYKITKENKKTVLTFSFGAAEDYWQFVDKGVKGVKSSLKAPISPFKFGTGSGGSGGLTKGINGWVRRKRIQFTDRKTKRFLSYDSTAFLIMRSIWNTGLRTTNFFSRPFDLGFEKLPDDLLDSYLFDLDIQIKKKLKL